jgi:hypothetical protein
LKLRVKRTLVIVAVDFIQVGLCYIAHLYGHCCVIDGANTAEAGVLACYRRHDTMGSSDWYVWVVGGFGAFVFDVTMNNARVFQMLAGFIKSSGF